MVKPMKFASLAVVLFKEEEERVEQRKKELIEEIKKITDENISAQDKYNERMEELNELLKEGSISLEEFEAAGKKAYDELVAASDKAQGDFLASREAAVERRGPIRVVGREGCDRRNFADRCLGVRAVWHFWNRRSCDRRQSRCGYERRQLILRSTKNEQAEPGGRHAPVFEVHRGGIRPRVGGSRNRGASRISTTT